VSAAEQRLLHRHFGSDLPTVVVPIGVEIGELAAARIPTRSGGNVRLLSVGRLDAYKQVDRLVAALRSLSEAELAVVGDGPVRRRLEAMASELDIADRVHLLGQISRNELLAKYQWADVFVSLSQRESFGLAMLEAAVAGLPVVASDIPAHREVASYLPQERVVFVQTACSPGELATAVREALTAGREMSVDGWPLPTWDAHAEATLERYIATVRLGPPDSGSEPRPGMNADEVRFHYQGNRR
jgi:glycosyltransferase involved in cell wall biosynthesis